MENKQFPEQGGPSFLPEDLEAFPLTMEPLDTDTPIIEELSYESDLPMVEEIPFSEDTTVIADLPTIEPETELPEVEIPVLPTPAEADFPAEAFPEEPFPIEEPLSMESADPVVDAFLSADPLPDAEEPVPEPQAPAEELLPSPEEAPETISFMERIPDVDEDYPPESAEEPAADPDEALSLPGEIPDIIADEQAMDAHGMLDHGEEEPPIEPEFPPVVIPDPIPQEEILDQEYRSDDADFDTMFHAPAPEKKEPEPHSVVRKGRPKRKKGEGLLGIPNLLVTVVWLALIVAIGVTAGRMLWICAADVLAFGREDKAVTLTVYEADTMDDIIDKLHENGLIRYKSLFKLYADISDAEEDIQPGIYDLNTRYDYHALVNFMSPRSSREVVDLTIPEGYTSRQIFALLEENRICTAVDIAAYAANGELDDYWFLEGVERGSENALEGYLFPDTYEFYKNSTPREALEKMLDNFEYRFNDELRAKIDTLNANITGGGYGIREVVIVASLIEKESAAPGESPMVAGVIYNRLFRWGSNPAYLNIDASIVYAQGGANESIDTKLDSPYNTYTNVGLTPGPISNPGLASLNAALAPESHNYYYYVLNPSTGMHQFSTTQDEHNAWIAQFYD